MVEKDASKNKTVTVVGIVVPVDWDENGNPLNVAISSHDEQEFVIENRNQEGKEVEKLLRQKIQVSGELVDSKGSRKQIRVKSYTKLDDNLTDDKNSWTLNVMEMPNPLEK